MGNSVQWFKLNPINGVMFKISSNDVEAYLSMKSLIDTKINYDSGNPIECRNDVFVINSLTSKEEINKIKREYTNRSELWKRIKCCVSTRTYYVSDLGRIKTVYKNGNEKIISQYAKSGRKKLMVKLPVGKNKYREEQVHRLVATTFILNPDGLDCVYHKDGDIFNNGARNLAWIDRNELGKLTGGLSKSLAVFKKDKDTGEVIDWYESISEAGRMNYLHRETIRLAVNGDLKTAGGFKWELDKEFNRDRKKSKA